MYSSGMHSYMYLHASRCRVHPPEGRSNDRKAIRDGGIVSCSPMGGGI